MVQIPRRRERWLLVYAAIRGACAGAVRAVVEWLLFR
jgi:hypothetical protein